MLTCIQKLTSLRISFLIRYCKEMVNLLFCVTWAYLENANINLKKILMSFDSFWQNLGQNKISSYLVI